MRTQSQIHFAPSSLAVVKNIVVATDLSDTERLLPHIIAQAKSGGAHVTLVHALPVPDEVVLGEQPTGIDKVRETQARQKLNDMAYRIEAEGIPCSTLLRRSVTVDLVQEAIEETDAGRLIIGTHRHGYAGQQMLGCEANALLRAAYIPVFVIGPHVTDVSSHVVPHSIVHPVSLTGQYRESAAFALELAQANQADLTLLHVLDEGVMRGSHSHNIFAKANQALAELIPPQHSPMAVHTVVECGGVPQEIMRICSVTNSDWILMGIERDFPWWSMSNNAAYQVIAQAECPVLVVRDDAIAERRERGVD